VRARVCVCVCVCVLSAFFLLDTMWRVGSRWIGEIARCLVGVLYAVCGIWCVWCVVCVVYGVCGIWCMCDCARVRGPVNFVANVVCVGVCA